MSGDPVQRHSSRGVRYLGSLATLLRTASRAVTAVLEAVGLVMLIIGVLIALFVAVTRNVGLSNLQADWMNDATQLALIVGALLYVVASDRHIGFQGLTHVLARRGGRAAVGAGTVRLVAEVFVIVLFVIVGVQGLSRAFQQVDFGGVVSNALPIPLWTTYLVVPVMLIGVALRLTAAAVSLVAMTLARRSGSAEVDHL